MVLRWWGMLLRVILVSNLAEVSRKEAKEQRRKARKFSFPVSDWECHLGGSTSRYNRGRAS